MVGERQPGAGDSGRETAWSRGWWERDSLQQGMVGERQPGAGDGEAPRTWGIWFLGPLAPSHLVHTHGKAGRGFLAQTLGSSLL